MMDMKSCLPVLLTVLLLPGAEAKTISTPAKPVVVVDGNSGARVCYYKGETYSEGAVLKVGEVLLQCLPAKDFELNGALKWVEKK